MAIKYKVLYINKLKSCSFLGRPDESLLPCTDFKHFCINYMPNSVLRITIGMQFDVQSFSSSNTNEALETFGNNHIEEIRRMTSCAYKQISFILCRLLEFSPVGVKYDVLLLKSTNVFSSTCSNNFA